MQTILVLLLKNALSSVLGLVELLVIYLAYHVPRPIVWDALVRARTIVLQLHQEKSKHELIREILQNGEQQNFKYLK